MTIKTHSPALLLAALLAAGSVAAATPATRLEYAKVTAAADVIQISRTKTFYTAAGVAKSRYRDAQIQLVIDPVTGVISNVLLVGESASPSTTPVFEPGLYKNLQNGCRMTLSKPTASSGGRQTFTATTDPAFCGTASNVNFQVQITTGAISGHPNETVIASSKCSFESSERAYGIGLNGSRDGTYPNEVNYLTDGINELTVTGLYNYGNGACQVQAGETFAFCAGGVCP